MAYPITSSSLQFIFLTVFNFLIMQMTVYASGVSVLMPGDAIPTFIAHPAPIPCPPEPFRCTLHQHISLPELNSTETSEQTQTRAQAQGQ